MNAAHHHPGHPVDRKFARSVAKRAVGTISSQWRELLAAPAPSGAERSGLVSLRNGAHTNKPRGGRRNLADADPRFIREIVREISRLIRPAKEAAQLGRAEALIQCLRIIDLVGKAGVAPEQRRGGEG